MTGLGEDGKRHINKTNMEISNLRRAISFSFIGGRNRAYEMLSGKRPLTIAMIRRLPEGLRSCRFRPSP